MPKIPWFRKWFEAKFGDLCADHDKEYAKLYSELVHKDTKKILKIRADYKMCKRMALRGHPFLAIGALVVFQLPWVGKF